MVPLRRPKLSLVSCPGARGEGNAPEGVAQRHAGARCRMGRALRDLDPAFPAPPVPRPGSWCPAGPAWRPREDWLLILHTDHDCACGWAGAGAACVHVSPEPGSPGPGARPAPLHPCRWLERRCNSWTPAAPLGASHGEQRTEEGGGPGTAGPRPQEVPTGSLRTPGHANELALRQSWLFRASPNHSQAGPNPR